MVDRDNWNIIIAGECMTLRPFSMHEEPEFMELVEMMRGADLTYAHLETNLAHFDEVEWPARGDWTGVYLIAKPEIAAELKWTGVDMLSLAHNHSFDFGAAVIKTTRKHVEAAGIAGAGIGADLEEARGPVFVETKKGRAALISASSGNKAFEWAGLPKSTWRGRPGVNPQRLRMKYVVDQEAAKQLQDIGNKLDILRTVKNTEVHERSFKEDNEFFLAQPIMHAVPVADCWVAGDHFGIESYCHEGDLRGNMRAVEEARDMADLVIVAHHFNISEGKRGDTPPMYAREFAHAAIDNGADIYVGHGWHRTMGIEIYKGKPIIYHIGNFWGQSEFVERVPFDAFEAYHHDVEKLPTLNTATYPLDTIYSHTRSDVWWTSALIGVEIRDNKLARISLTPVELGRDATKEGIINRGTGRGTKRPNTDGRPLLANGKNARLILERYQRLSKEMGTEVRIEGDRGYIDLQ